VPKRNDVTCQCVSAECQVCKHRSYMRDWRRRQLMDRRRALRDEVRAMELEAFGPPVSIPSSLDPGRCIIAGAKQG
jgi:hypothetical protein